MAHLLHSLLREAEVLIPKGLPNPLIEGVVCDSRRVKKGDLFFGVPGENFDGGSFWAEAIGLGAVAAVIGSSAAMLKTPDETDPVVIVEENIEELIGKMLSAFWENPSAKLSLIGVTGTNGKTTTTHLIEYLSSAIGKPSALFGTLVNRWPSHEECASLTTGFADSVQANLSKAVLAGSQLAAMEVSSHALSQYRVAGCSFAGSVFTNLTQDHLDFHDSMEKYFEAKTLLFHPPYLKSQTNNIVINIDDKWGKLLARQLQDRCWKCSLNKQEISFGNPELFITDVTMTSKGATGHLYSPVGDGCFVLPLIGRFNLMNFLQAIGALLQQGLPLNEMLEEVESFPGVPGRMEKVLINDVVDSSLIPTLIVDYAHTPDALKNALIDLRPFCQGRLICVFGCGGDRDKSKRAKMGNIAAQLADLIIVTSDNPRKEDPMNIIQDVLKGITAKDKITVEVDRAKAIQVAVALASPDDLVLIAGKGHENYQIIDNVKKNFDDRDCARNAIVEQINF